MKKPRGGVIRRGRMVVRQKKQQLTRAYDKNSLHGSNLIRAFVRIRFNKISPKRMRIEGADSLRKSLGFLTTDSQYMLERLQINRKTPYMAFIPSATLRR